MKKVAVSLCVIALISPLVLTAMPAMAEPDADSKSDLDIQKQLEKAGESLKDSLTTLMNLVEKMVKGVPQYEAPEILDNGDIIIRRKPVESEKSDKADTHIKT